MTTGQIVDNAHFESAREQQIDHVAADEAGATGHDGDRFRHAALSAFILRTLK